ncbi:MAG TPA: hypothetical protein VGN46_03620 [Luteibacter sp.]|jgi:hypothetical protein|uniref:hypothetical protein n=1 Tax=Luteibacter sp. TaxID=1886636 RepID=UPI002F42DD4A
MAHILTRTALAAAALFAVPVASAGNPHGDDLPVCPPAGVQPDECLIALADPGFEGDGSLLSWMPAPMNPAAARIDREGGKARLELAPGGSVSQFVELPLGTAGDMDAYFVPSLFARSAGGNAQVELSISLQDDSGSHAVFSHVYTTQDDWTRPSGGFDASQARGRPRSLLLQIIRRDKNGGTPLYVDDVQVIRQR